MNKVAAVLAVAFGASACEGAIINENTNSVDQEIRNGDPARGREFNGVGAFVTPAGSVVCSGVMISPNVVLTSAQCVRDPLPQPYIFRLREKQTAAVTAVRKHPLCDGPDGFNLTFDIALVRLDRSDTRGWHNVTRYEIAATDVPVGAHATGVGFGESPLRPGSRTQGDFIVTQNIPGEGPVGVIHQHAFLEVVPGNATDQMICPGDSGGPLFYDQQMVGLASFRFVETCPEAGPGYHVSLPRLRGWIQQTLSELEPPGACLGEDDENFVSSGGGCTDVDTGLTWSARSPVRQNQEDAVASCEALEQGGQDDWRLPTKDELEALGEHRSDCDNDDDDDHGHHGHHGHHGRHGRWGWGGHRGNSSAHTGPNVPHEAWSSSTGHHNKAWMYDFDDGDSRLRNENRRRSFLCVRGPATPE